MFVTALASSDDLPLTILFQAFEISPRSFGSVDSADL